MAPLFYANNLLVCFSNCVSFMGSSIISSSSFLANVYTDRIKPIIETENMLVPKVKPLVDQMNTLK